MEAGIARSFAPPEAQRGGKVGVAHSQITLDAWPVLSYLMAHNETRLRSSSKELSG
jgi:hypothetical protein